MTDQPRRVRWSRRHVRLLAWVAGAATFLSFAGVLGAAPKPAEGTEASPRVKPRQRIIVRKIVRRVVIVDPVEAAPITYVTVPGTTGGSGSVGSTSSGAGTAAPPPPPPPTGGS